MRRTVQMLLGLTLCDSTDLEPTRLLCPWRFSRQEYWSVLPCSSPGNLPNLGIEPWSLVLWAEPWDHLKGFSWRHTNVFSLILASQLTAFLKWNTSSMLLTLQMHNTCNYFCFLVQNYWIRDSIWWCTQSTWTAGHRQKDCDWTKLYTIPSLFMEELPKDQEYLSHRT